MKTAWEWSAEVIRLEALADSANAKAIEALMSNPPRYAGARWWRELGEKRRRRADKAQERADQARLLELPANAVYSGVNNHESE